MLLTESETPAYHWDAVLCLVTQSCPVAHQAPLSTGILQAGILEWVAMPSSRGSSPPRDWTHVSLIAGRFFTIWATRETHWMGWWKVLICLVLSQLV